MEIAAIHGKDIVSGFHIDAGLGQWRFIAGIPIFTVVDFGNAIAAIFQTIVGTKQSAFEFFWFWGFAAADKHVADRHLAQALLK